LPGGPGPAAQQLLAPGAVRVISESGRVSWVRSGGDLWALVEGAVVPAGREIVAESDGHAILELSDTSRVEVFPNSRLTFRSARGNWKDLLDLALGKVRIHIEKVGGLPNLYKMFSPTAIIAVRGTTFNVEVDPSGTTMVSVEEGLVGVSHLKLDDEVRLEPGQSATIYAIDPVAQSRVDKLRTATRIIVNVTERAVEIVRQVDAVRVPGAPGTSTTASSTTTTTTTTPTATVGTGSASGSGTSTPPSNGRGSGSGNNGDTGTTPTNPGTGSPGTGAPGAGPASAGPSSAGAATQSRKP
jgi:hypothetical protein